MPDNEEKTGVSSSILGVEAGDTTGRITHSAPFLTRGSDEQWDERLARATRKYDQVSGREL